MRGTHGWRCESCAVASTSTVSVQTNYWKRKKSDTVIQYHKKGRRVAGYSLSRERQTRAPLQRAVVVSRETQHACGIRPSIMSMLAGVCVQ